MKARRKGMKGEIEGKTRSKGGIREGLKRKGMRGERKYEIIYVNITKRDGGVDEE